VSAERPEPPTSEVTEPFWEATRSRRLLVQWCVACDKPIWYPRAVCPGCLGDELEWRPSAGTGRVHAVTVEYRPQDPRLADRAPYAVALIDLDEGVRVLSNVVGADPVAVDVDALVAVDWEPLSDGRHLPVFVLAPGEEPCPT
jgi:uncharacterized OB-fold protein